MNILHESAINECTSCQMCGAVCRANAITIHLNNDGFYRPSIDNDKCTDCGQCINVCHKFDNSIQKTSNDKLDQCLLFAASAKNDEIVELSFSDTSKPMGVATYRTSQELPPEIRQALPDMEDLKKLITE